MMIVGKLNKTQGVEQTDKVKAMFAICHLACGDTQQKCLIPIQPCVNWHTSVLHATALCNHVLKSIDANFKTIPTLTLIDDKHDETMQQAVWQDFSKLCCAEDVVIDFLSGMTAQDSDNNRVYLAKMAYSRKHDHNVQVVPLEIWCLQHPAVSCLLLPTNIGLDPKHIAQSMSVKNGQERKEMCIASMVACNAITDRYIPRHNCTRFDFGSQCITTGNKINTSGACTYSQMQALLNYDNRDFLQSLGVADMPHTTSCFVHGGVNMYLFINTFRAENKNYAVHTIYL